ncbi:hypothetical protein KQH49_06280 [Mycetohabitans sp. B5]|uniref:hypothetical protein n=1 Tax=Mycetohabitans TaxID=2571159 RepID=UPI001E453F61|nr:MULTISPECIES: hypothetical protein [Mycetohabitans]MCG1054587.1 hypothetical protein [Mycetohabitans sp. B5]
MASARATPVRADAPRSDPARSLAGPYGSNSVRDILISPQSGVVPEELVDCNPQQYRQVISDMNRILYEVWDTIIYLHIICDIRRDMRTLLSRRLLRVTK